jgi:multicomponent Na+:H+ antiporter subunit F
MTILDGYFALPFFDQFLEILLLIQAISLLLCFYRLAKGPDVPNRTVAFDLIAVHAVGIFALFAMRYQQPWLLEGAIVTAVLGFLGTVMFARYLEEAGTNESQELAEETPPQAPRPGVVAK